MSALLKPGLNFRLVQLATCARVPPLLAARPPATAPAAPDALDAPADAPADAHAADGQADAHAADAHEADAHAAPVARPASAPAPPRQLERAFFRPHSAPPSLPSAPSSLFELIEEIEGRPTSAMVEAHAVKLLLLERLFRSAAGALCFGGKCMCMCTRAVPPPALPTRRLNPYPAEFRRSIISLTDLDKNEGSIAIRNRLKVSYRLEPLIPACRFVPSHSPGLPCR